MKFSRSGEIEDSVRIDGIHWNSVQVRVPLESSPLHRRVQAKVLKVVFVLAELVLGPAHQLLLDLGLDAATNGSDGTSPRQGKHDHRQ